MRHRSRAWNAIFPAASQVEGGCSRGHEESAHWEGCSKQDWISHETRALVGIARSVQFGAPAALAGVQECVLTEVGEVAGRVRQSWSVVVG